MDTRSQGGGRHAGARVSRFDGPTLAILVAIIAALVAGGAGAASLLNGDDSGISAQDGTGADAPTDPPTGEATDDSTETADACEAVTEVTVGAAPEVAPAVQSAADLVDAAACATFVVSAQRPSEVAAAIEAGQAPDVWVPDAADWPTRITEYRADSGPFTLAEFVVTASPAPELTAEGWTTLGSVARTPIVLAVDAQNGLPPSTTWREMFTSSPRLALAQPSTDSATRLAYLVARGATPADDDDYLLLGQRIIFVSRFAANATTDLLESATGGPEHNPFPVAEQHLAEFSAENDDTSLAPLILGGGSPELSYPLSVRSDVSTETATAAQQLWTAIGSDEVRSWLTEAGFRAADGAGPTINGVAAAAYEAAPMPDAARAIEATHLWETLRLDMQMIAAIDVSGSMEWAAGDTTRLDLLQRATVNALEVLPDGSRIGAWVFATQIGADNEDWQPIVPARPLTEAVDGRTQRQILKDEVAALDERITGDTGLYDTAHAAFLQVQADYDPRYINSVVLITDGENDDPTGGLSLEQLLAELEAEHDPERPVRIVTIGIGPDTDPAALEAISSATGGTSYVAVEPDDIEIVFFRALLARAA